MSNLEKLRAKLEALPWVISKKSGLLGTGWVVTLVPPKEVVKKLAPPQIREFGGVVTVDDLGKPIAFSVIYAPPLFAIVPFSVELEEYVYPSQLPWSYHRRSEWSRQYPHKPKGGNWRPIYSWGDKKAIEVVKNLLSSARRKGA
jgi:hypothetical protein